MAKLQFYMKEEKEFEEEYENILIPDSNVNKVLNKLVRHFKLHPYQMKFWGYYLPGGSGASIEFHGSYTFITLPHNPPIAVICHELAHDYCRIKYKTHRHGKKMMKCMKKMIEYCRKMDYWGLSK